MSTLAPFPACEGCDNRNGDTLLKCADRLLKGAIAFAVVGTIASCVPPDGSALAVATYSTSTGSSYALTPAYPGDTASPAFAAGSLNVSGTSAASIRTYIYPDTDTNPYNNDTVPVNTSRVVSFTVTGGNGLTATGFDATGKAEIKNANGNTVATVFYALANTLGGTQPTASNPTAIRLQRAGVDIADGGSVTITANFANGSEPSAPSLPFTIHFI